MGQVIDRRTGEAVAATPEDVERGVLDGTLAVSGDLEAMSPDGRVGKVRADSIEQALAKGYKLITPEQHRSKILEREESDAGSMALGAIETVGSALTFGGLAQAERVLGVDMQRAQARRKGLGGLGTALEVGASVAPALVTGGTSTLARALLAAPKAVSSAAARVGAAAGRLGTGTAARVGSIAARGATEGAAYGVGAEITEAALGDRELTAERLAASGLLGAVLGSGADVAGHAALRGLVGGAKMAKSAVGTVLERSGLQAGDSIANAIAGRISGPLSKAQAAVTGGPESTIRKTLGDLATSEGRQKTLVASRHMAEVREKAARGVQEAWDDLSKAADDAHRFLGGEMKVRQQAVRVPVELEKGAVQSTKAMLGEVADELDRLLASPNYTGKASLEKLSALARQHMRRAQRSGKGVTAYRAADTMKRDFDAVLGKMKALTSDDAATRDAVISLRKKLKENLEDSAIWGAAADSQRAVNRAVSTMMESRKVVPKSFRDGPLDAQAALSMVRKIGRYGGETKHDAIVDYMSNRMQVLAEMKRNYVLTPEQKASFAKAFDAQDRFLKQLRQTEDMVRKSDELELLRSYEGEGSPSIGAVSSLGTLVGFGAAGVPGAMLGTAVTRPYTTARVLAGILESVDGVAGKTKAAVNAITGSRVGQAAQRAGRSVADAAVRVGRRRAAMAASAADYASAPDPERIEPQLMASSPDEVLRRIRPVTAQLEEHAPELTGSLVQAAIRAATYLASIDPRPPANPYTGTRLPPSEAAKERWARGTSVVRNPVGVLERIADGTVSLEDGEALRAVYPTMYADTRNQILSGLQAAVEDGAPVDYDTRIKLGLVFQLPTDPAIDPTTAWVLTQQRAQVGPEDPIIPRGSGQNSTTDNYKTATERLQE